MASDGGNQPPKFVSPLHDVVFVEGRAETFTFPASTVRDDDSTTLGFEWTVSPGGVPSWLRFDNVSLTLSGTAPPGSPNYVISVTVSDGQSTGGPERFTLITNAASGNRAPVVSASLTEQAWAEGAPGSFAVPAATFADPDGDALSLSARLSTGAALPSWLIFTPATRSLSGTPPVGSDDLTLRITATDPAGASVFADLLLRTTSSTPLSGTAGPDVIDGSAGNDTIRALAGDDVVNAGAGDDLIDGGPGADRLNGGAGLDTALYTGSRGDYLLGRASTGVVTVADRSGTLDTLTEIETVQIGDERIATSTLSYQPSVSLPADGVSNLVFRFYNSRDKAYFYTPSAAEKDMVVLESTDASYTPANGVWPYFYQGATFGQAASGGLPVYRFYNTQTGHHFFTISEAERALVRRESTDPSYTPENGVWPFVDEGVGFLAHADAGHAGSVPVYRFYSPTLNRHFFTASADEAQQIRLSGQWNDEGTGFWGGALTSNRAPVLATALADQSWNEGQAGSYQFPAAAFSDADGDPLTYTAATAAGASLPSWLSFTPATRTFSGTPPAGTADVAVRVTASDGRGGSVFDDFTIATPTAAAGDDYAASTSTAGRVAAGGSATGTIESAGDADWFRVALTAGRTYTINLEGSPNGNGTLSDPSLLGVYDSAGKAIANTSNNDIGSKDRNARVSFTPSGNGDYFIAAGGNGPATGTYRLSVTAASTSTDDYAATTSTTGAVSVGGSVGGSIEAAGDSDWFRVSLSGGRTYIIDLEGSPNGNGTLADPSLLGIWDSRGKAVNGTSNNDIGGSDRNARVVYTPSSDGDYFIAAGANGSVTGTYRLSVTLDDYPATTATTGSVSVGSSATGNVETSGDVDWFRVSLTAGRPYTINLEGAPNGNGTLADPSLLGIFDRSGKSIANTSNNDIGSKDRNARVSFTPSSSGDYYIAAGGNGTVTGTYRVSVTAATSGSAPELRPAAVIGGGVEAARAAPISANGSAPSGIDAMAMAVFDTPWLDAWHAWHEQLHGPWVV